MRSVSSSSSHTPPKVRFVPHFDMLQENNIRRGFLQDEQYLRLSRECAVEGMWLVGLFETAYAYFRAVIVCGFKERQFPVDGRDRVININPKRAGG
jgi:hypothetical protein